MTSSLPIDDVLPEIVERVRADRCVVVEAPPGAGKSTRVPPALLDAGLTDKSIVVLEPRRVAARAVASRIAAERHEPVGQTVGWHIRWDRRGGDNTRLWVITEGILTRRATSNPFLDDIGLLILDEFHERSIHTDLAIGFARELLELRDDLRVVVMSATLDAERIASFLGCGSVSSDGRLHPVEKEYLNHEVDDLPREVTRAIRRLITAEDDDGGDILVFLPGLREIDACRDGAKAIASEHDLALHRLHGRLAETEQDAALAASSRRKVIFSTNIAETSLTIEGLTAVIDSGLVRTVRADTGTGFDRLETDRISLASAEQRAGRAGRTRPGRAIRLWTTASEFRMRDYDEPAVARIDLTGPVLDVIRWSGADPADFPWFEAPPPARLDLATETLRGIGALDGWAMTSTGTELSDMPLHPRIGRFLLEAREEDVGRLAADVAASLSESGWVRSVRNDAPPTLSDPVMRGELLRDVARGHTQRARTAGLSVNVGAARAALRVARDLERWCSDSTTTDTADAARRALVAAYGDRIGFRRGDRRYALSQGGSVVLGYESTVGDAEAILAVEIFGTAYADGVECGIARQASSLDVAWLEEEFPDRFHDEVIVRFDSRLDRLTARRVRRFDDLVLDEEPASLDEADVSGERLATAIAEVVAADPAAAFKLKKDSLLFLQRVDFLREWMPDLEFPNPRDVEFLKGLVWGKTSLAELRRIGFKSLYSNFLRGQHFDALERHAPERYQLPSGRAFRIDYSDPTRPVLAARIQDFFGQRVTPRLADGRATMILHLLAPNMRPQQITTDLESFWNSTYAEVRKELRARYPKHDWPENP